MSGEQAQPPPASAAKLERNQLFISYSRVDRPWVEKFLPWIRFLERTHGLSFWDDSQIPPGGKWHDEIQQALRATKVALLLVSQDFLNSDYVARSELPQLLDAAEREGLCILWVPVRHSLVHLTPISAYQAAISPDCPLEAMSPPEREKALLEISNTISAIFMQAREQEERQRQQEEAERVACEKAEAERQREEEQQAREQEERERQEAERAAHDQKLRRYEQEFRRAIETQYPLDPFVEQGLKQFQQELELSDEDDAQIQAPLIAPKEAERVAREKRDVNARKTPAEPSSAVSSPWPDTSAPPLPEGTERSGFGPLEMATIRREGSTWEIQRQAIETWGFRERLAEGVELKMVAIPAGSFLMGSPADEPERSSDEGPQHEVRLAGFFLCQAPITQAQWKVVAGWEKVELDLNPDPSNFKGLNRPVEQVTWQQAMEFCRRLSRRTGRRYGLPSEAQWEYACRAGTTTPFHFGKTITTELANYDASSTYGGGPKGTYRQQTTAVGMFTANAWGLQDMHGTVWEWCEDVWHENYQGAPRDGRPWNEPQANAWIRKNWRQLRGGSWDNHPRFCRSASRHCHPPSSATTTCGFRVSFLPPGSSS